MSDEEPRPRGFSLIVVPDGGGESRTYRLSATRLRALIVLGVTLAVAGLVMAASWFSIAARASRASRLEERVAELQADRDRLRVLAGRIDELEARYDRIRSLFGADDSVSASELWLPPALGSARSRRGTDSEDAVPTSWPLTARGFVTRGLLAGERGEDHPGLDIAVPVGTYVRAAAAGVASEVGEDPVYGLFLVIDHDGGYRTRYAHATQTLVSEGDRVRRNEVIALSGSTGRSTAPHLHFEILLNGEPVDPLTLVQQPS